MAGFSFERIFEVILLQVVIKESTENYCITFHDVKSFDKAEISVN